MASEKSSRPRWIFAALVACLLAFDLSHAPHEQLSTRLLLGGIGVYQATLSPRMPGLGVHCRFTPTCSHYGEAVIRKHGALVGTWLAVKRIARCGPWTPMGTEDPPP